MKFIEWNLLFFSNRLEFFSRSQNDKILSKYTVGSTLLPGISRKTQKTTMGLLIP